MRCFGIKAGVAATNQDWQYLQYGGGIGAQTRWGADVGGFVEWLNMPILSVSSEVHYIQKGFKVRFLYTTEQFPDGNGTYLTHTPRVDYLSIPILAKCRYELPSFSLYAFAGPRIDIFLSTRDEGYGAVINKFKSNDLGATMGLGFEAFQVGPATLGAEFRYSPTFQDSYSTNLLTVRNRSLEMLLVLSF